MGAPKTFGNFGFPCVFLDFQQQSKKTHGNFLVFSRNPKNTWKFLDFQQKSKKHMEIFGFSAEIQKTHGNFWIFSRNPKKHMESFGFSAEIQAEASNTARITIMQLSCEPQRKLPQVEISIGMASKIQDPRLSRGLLAESWIPIETD